MPCKVTIAIIHDIHFKHCSLLPGSRLARTAMMFLFSGFMMSLYSSQPTSQLVDSSSGPQDASGLGTTWYLHVHEKVLCYRRV